MKHYWHHAAFIPQVTDRAAAWKVAARFRALHDDDFTGGFMLRRHEQLISAQARTWRANGTCRLVTARPDTPMAAGPRRRSPTGGLPRQALPGLPVAQQTIAYSPQKELSAASH
jgi:hypothetical protein